MDRAQILEDLKAWLREENYGVYIPVVAVLEKIEALEEEHE